MQFFARFAKICRARSGTAAPCDTDYRGLPSSRRLPCCGQDAAYSRSHRPSVSLDMQALELQQSFVRMQWEKENGHSLYERDV